MSSGSGSGTSILDALRFLLDLNRLPGILLDSGRKVIHANPQARANGNELDLSRQRELAGFAERSNAPPQVFVFHIEQGPIRGHLVLDARGPVDVDAGARAVAARRGFTQEQTHVGRLWGRGMTPEQIAAELGKGIETIRSHVKQVREKSGITRQIDWMNLVRNWRGPRTDT